MDINHPAFSWARFVMLIICLLILFGIGYKTFIQRTDQTVVQSGGTNIVYMNKPQFPLLGCSLWKVHFETYFESSPSKPQVKK